MKTTIFTQMSQLAHEYDAINLAQGFPGFSCDQRLIDLANHNMNEGFNQYSPMAGMPILRTAIRDKVNKSYGFEYDVEQEICVTNGATEAVYVAIQSVVEKGDEVIVFEPAFDIYRSAVEMAKGKVVPVKLNPEDYSILWDEVATKVNNATKLVIINSPHNPTGAVLSEDDLSALERLARQHDFLILSDEVYEHIVFDGNVHHSIIQNQFLRERAFVTFSLGKVFHVTGWRIGYCLAPKELMDKFKYRHQYTTFSAPTPFQLACADFLQEEENYNGLSKFFEEKRDYFLDQMKRTAFVPIPSAGTYFQLMSYKNSSSENDIDFAKRITKEFKVASIPISFFYEDETDHKVLRFCFAKSNEDLQTAADRLARITNV